MKAVSTMPTSLDVPTGSMGPNDKDVMSQLNISHPLQLSEIKVNITFHYKTFILSNEKFPY